MVLIFQILFFFSRCTFICHIGDCSDETLCKKKVKLYGPCKRRKQEIACNKAKDFSVKCDEECNQIKQKVWYFFLARCPFASEALESKSDARLFF
jgi:hypothetical protein